MGMALLRLFGHPVLESDGTRTPLKVPAKAVALLSIVAANHMRPLSREWLSQTLWPDCDPAEARTNLRRHLHLCLRAIGDDVLTLTRTTVQWNGESETDVDVIRFDTFAQTHAALAIQEYSGEFCSGIADESLEALRIRYRSAYESLLRGLIAGARTANDDAQLAVWLQRALNHDPFDEDAVRQIMELRMRNGDRTGAIREYNAFSQRLRSELATEPQAQTTALFHAITGASEAPRIPNNLPNASTTFVGRENDLARLADALRNSRIVTLLGPGGIGKSRLALRCAHNVLPKYPGGAWFVSLEHAQNEAAIWEHISRALNLPASRTPQTAVLGALERSAPLLLLDTCEHAIEGARRVAEFLTSATSVTVLATSRRKLGAHGEQSLEVTPLELPPYDCSGSDLMRFAAYRLFVERATSVNPAFRVEARDVRAFADVLRRTDGLPLAIELVASRANVLTIEGMRKRMPAAMATSRVRTIDDTIAWSYGLLSDKQQRVFRWLSAFQAAFDIDDAEQLCPEGFDVAACLFELVDASLVSVTADGADVRYHLLETTRACARRLLMEWEGADALLRHAELCALKAAELAAASEDRIGALLPGAMRLMPDYLAALDFTAQHNRLDIGLSILEGTYHLVVRRYFVREVLECTQALLHRSDSSSAEQRVRLLRIATMAAQNGDQYESALSLADSAAQLYSELGDEARACDAFSAQAVALFYLGRNAESEKLLLEVCERAKRAGATRIYLKSAGRLGALITSYERAKQLLVPVVEEMRRLGDARQAAYTLRNIAACAFFEACWTEAAQWADQAVKLLIQTGDDSMRALLLTMRGCALQEAGETEQSLRSHLEALTLCAAFDEHIEAVECLEDIAATLGNLDDFTGAARVVGYAMRARNRLGVPLTEQQNTYYEPARARVARSLGAHYEAERAVGAQMNASEVVRWAGSRLVSLLPTAQLETR